MVKLTTFGVCFFRFLGVGESRISCEYHHEKTNAQRDSLEVRINAGLVCLIDKPNDLFQKEGLSLS